MKVKDLIALLKEYDEDAKVLLETDDGNRYRDVNGVDEDSYYDGGNEDVFLSHYSSVDEMAQDFFDGEDIYEFIESLQDVVVLY